MTAQSKEIGIDTDYIFFDTQYPGPDFHHFFLYGITGGNIFFPGFHFRVR